LNLTESKQKQLSEKESAKGDFLKRNKAFEYNPVVCGRRFCRVCKRWRHVVDYRITMWADADKTIPLYYSSYCYGCESGQKRQKRANGYVPEKRRFNRTQKKWDPYIPADDFLSWWDSFHPDFRKTIEKKHHAAIGKARAEGIIRALMVDEICHIQGRPDVSATLLDGVPV
jgi:hypothetical protein